ncbi:phage integrase SAM-like domain-containing protein [Sabulilitoribacter multivorans]|uniref:Phage integrase SAM-like domain-containing protein n=1 Tax=Flaviramulus multivorans TaxID=1304750 RepID=A0ABS9IF88_9FLAO|nr:phage integrase SAM-like domain-containing protein [Flaviramulus multivorans]MCF7559427.1 phage integrase SAM-like domain-containing protein [Flaviramulus multivorans]
MAAVNYLYRSLKEKAFLNLRLLFTYNNTNHVIGGKTKLEVSKLYWDKYHFQKSPKDIDIKNQQVEVNAELNKIENHILKAFNDTIPDRIDKAWLSKQLDLYYNPPKKAKALPKGLLPYFDFYLRQRNNELAEQTLKNYKVVRSLIEKYESSISKNINIIDIDSIFKTNFEAFCLKKGYAINTISRAIHTIKAVCKHAMYNGIEISPQLERIKLKEVKGDIIYLTIKELEAIEKLDDKKLNESLLNARDWLIISCFTASRVSEFMRFTKEKIRIEKGKHLIEFTQKKTGKNMTIPLHSKILKILEKRGGEFPRPISSQKYNAYIKKVCKKAKIKKKVKGSKLEKIDDSSKFPYRKQAGEYEKWELVTSHIGRRSFSSNFYGEIPTSFLIYVTGHKTEQMFLNYIGKGNKDIALELTKYF